MTKLILLIIAVQYYMDIVDIRVAVDIKLSTIKPIHAKSMVRSYRFLKSEAGQKIIGSGWRAVGCGDYPLPMQ